jgi:hypothetical protein
MTGCVRHCRAEQSSSQFKCEPLNLPGGCSTKRFSEGGDECTRCAVARFERRVCNLGASTKEAPESLTLIALDK